MKYVFMTGRTVLIDLYLVLFDLLVLGRVVILPFTTVANQCYYFPHLQ